MITVAGELRKSVAFFVLDLVIVSIFTYLWFHLVQKRPNPVRESFWFVAFMQGLFFIYYFAFDSWMDGL